MGFGIYLGCAVRPVSPLELPLEYPPPDVAPELPEDDEEPDDELVELDPAPAVAVDLVRVVIV